MDTVARLNAAGIPCGVLMAPMLPGISDAPEQIEAVVAAAVEAGAPWIDADRPAPAPRRARPLPGLAGADAARAGGGHAAALPRAYAPEAERNDLTARVRRLVERHGGTRIDPGRRFGRPSPRDNPAPPLPRN